MQPHLRRLVWKAQKVPDKGVLLLKNQCLLLQISQNSVKTPRFPTRRSRTKLYRPLVSNLCLKWLFGYKMSYFRFEIDLYYCICGFLVHFGTFWGILVKNPVNLGKLSLHFKLSRGNPAEISIAKLPSQCLCRLSRRGSLQQTAELSSVVRGTACQHGVTSALWGNQRFPSFY